jgi:hypothetical protein
MTYADRILDYLWSIAPDGATNHQIATRLMIRSQQTVYLLTQQLLRRRQIDGEQRGREWVYYSADESSSDPGPVPETANQSAQSGGPLSPARFEALARDVLTARFGSVLSAGSVPGVRKRFDFVSLDRRIIGDAKFYTLVQGVNLPSAKFATIAEYVWLLEKTGAPTTFLVFGNERQVPLWWLERYGNLATDVTFYFLTPDGQLEVLAGPDNGGGEG